MRHRIFLGFLLFLFFWSITTTAAEIDVKVSSRETYVGLPITLQIHIENASTHEPPALPDVPGLVIQLAGPPSRSSRMSIANGQVTTHKSITYRYTVTPQREGTFTIPPVKVVADGLASITKAVRLVVTKSETGDLMFVEVAGNKKEIFVGEALQWKLQIWIRPYRDADREISLSESDMWRCISDQTRWGAFAESLEELAKNRQRPSGRSVLRRDSEGNEREYFLYEIDARVYPTRLGPIDGGDVRIVVDYPTAIGRNRTGFPSIFDDEDFPFGGSIVRGPMFGDAFFGGFGSRLAVTSVRPVVAETKVEPMKVKPIPESGRPDDYRGAIGQYQIVTEASPTKVKVDDPVTLHIGIDGTGPMDLVRAPPLELQPSLTSGFKVPDEQLSGFVDGKRKLFSTTIRPKHTGVTEIPAISFSYFDPEKEQFVTVASDPIAIEVEQADVLAMESIVGNRPKNNGLSDADRATLSKDRPDQAPLKLFTGNDLLIAQPRLPLINRMIWAVLCIPPGITFVAMLYSWRSLLERFVSARRRFDRSLAAAQTPAEVVSALDRFLATRLGIEAEHSSQDRTVGELRSAGQSGLAIRVERLYTTCRKPEFAIEQSLEELKAQATEVAADTTTQTKGTVSSSPRRRATASLLISALVIATAGNCVAAEVTLSVTEQQDLLDEAIAIYEDSQSMGDSSKQTQRYAESAASFQALVDSGVQNDKLYFNLGAAYLQADQPTHAIVNFRRALRMNPTHRGYHHQLKVAQNRVASDSSPGGLDILQRINDALLAWISPSFMKVSCLAAWVAFWCVIILRVFEIRFPWKSASVVAMLVVLFSGGSYLLRTAPYMRDDTVVLVTDPVVLREGDGEEFSVTRELDQAAGMLAILLDQRGGWTHILIDGDSGWVRNASVQRI